MPHESYNGRKRVNEVLVAAVVGITLALVLYTSGVWAERTRGTLIWPHVVLFAAGLACTLAGTAMMTRLAADPSVVAGAGAFTTVMKLSGGVAIIQGRDSIA